MAKIQSPLKVGNTGAAVANLQDGLRQLLERGAITVAKKVERLELTVALAAERLVSAYGPATEKLVSLWQEQHKLKSNGKVDEATAASLDAGLAAPDKVDPPQPPPSPFPAPLHEGAEGADVALAHDIFTGLGLRIAPPELRDRRFGKSSAAAASAWQKLRGLAETGVLDMAALDRLAADGRGLARIVSGVVRLDDGTPVPGLPVVAFDRDFRNEQELGRAVTDRQGRYRIAYTSAAFARAERGAADLGVKVLSADGATIVHAPKSAELVMNAPRESTTDIIVALPRGAVPSEFELIACALRPLVADVPFADIGREARSDEGDFLALETGLDLGRIGHFVVAHRLGDYSKQAPEYFYALLREDGLFGIAPGRPRAVQTPVGLASDTRAVLFEAVLLDEEVAAAALARALRKRLVPPSTGESAASVRKALQRWREEAEAFARREVPRNILSVVETLIDKGKSLEMLGFLETFDPVFLTNVYRQLDDLGAFAPDARQKAETRLKLGELLGFNLGLVEEVAESLGVETPDDVRRLARLERKDWTDLIARGAEQVSLGGEAIEPALARRQSSIIVRRFETSFPTTAFTAQLARGKSRAIPDRDRIVEFMEAHPGLELREHNLVPFLKQAGVDPASVAPEVIAGVEKVQRVFQLTGNFRKTEGLLGAGYGASADIVEAGRGRFVADARRFAGMGEAEAKEIFHAAENTNLAAIMVATNLRTLSGPIAPQGRAAASLTRKIDQIVADQPSLKSLFGGADVCECVHCRSIYSPACYVTDVLRFLRNRLVRSSSGPSTKAAKDELFKRRPDLGEIDLNCDNAHVEVPHIDIVCELAEEACAPDPGFAFTGAIADGAASASLLAAVRSAGFEIGDDATVYGPYAPDRFMLRDKGIAIALSGPGPTWSLRRLRQTHGTSEERAAAPEYVNMAAYALLANAKAAFELPFDLPHAETGALLAAAGVARAALMETLAVGASPSVDEIAAETLGLSSAESALIFAASVGDQAQIWGVAGATAAAAMAKLDLFTRRTELQYRDLEPLLGGAYVRQGVDLFIRHLDNSCNLAAKEIVNLDDEVLDRMHRVLRLARKTGVSARDIDRLAAAPRLGAGDLGNAALLSLATLKRVSDDLDVGIGRLITWLDLIPTDGERSDHAQLFQNPARTGKLDDDLAPQAIRDNEAAELAVPGSGVKLGALAPDLALGFGVRAADVDALLERLSDPALFGANPPLTFAALAALHGRIGLLRALRLKAEDLVTLERLAGVDPLASATALHQFMKTVQAIAKTGVRISELAFRLAPTAADLLTPELADAAILKTLDTLGKRLIEAATANLSPYDDDLGSSEQIPAFEAILERPPLMDSASVTRLVDVLRLEAPSAAGAAAVALAAKSVVDGPLAGLIDGAAAKLEIDAIVTDALGTGANAETLRKGLLALVMQGLADSARQTVSLAAADSAVADLLRISPEIAGTILHGDGPLGKGATLPIGGVSTALSEILVAGNVNELSDGTLDWAWLNSSANLHRALRLAHAISKFILPFEPSAETLAFLLEKGPALGWLPLDLIPFEAASPPVMLVKWLQLADVFALIAEYPPVLVPGQPGVTVNAPSLFALTLDATTVRSDLLDALAILTGWPRDLLDDADTRFGFTRPDYRLPTTWRRLARAIALVHSLDVSLAQALAFTVATLGDAERRNARTMLRARYSDSEWLGALKAIMDPIRARKRDALVAYLLAANPNLTSKADLYDHFLTDTEWSPKMPSSRIVHAHGTLQLFIQRCIAGLEPNATADLDGDPDWNWWQWMRNYRLWEVNRKVFVEAQYYIRPEWRDDKTEPFADMESALLQNEINQENIEAAYEGYLDRLDEIAFMEVLATCYDFDREDMHIFARTKGGDPRAYFHRVLQRERVLTPWTKIDLDITGEHLIAFFRNKRLYLAWATFLEKADEDQSATYPSPDSDIADLKAERFTQIGLAISEYTGKKWLPRRISEGTIDTDKQNQPLDRGNISLAVTPNKSRFTVDVFWQQGSRTRLGYFLLTGCKGYPEAVNERAYRLGLLPAFKDAPLKAQRFVEENRLPGDELAICTAASGSAFNTLFRLTPGNFRVTFPFQASELDQLMSALMSMQFGARGDFAPKIFGTLMPFFFEDNLRGYMLVPGFYGELDQETGIRRTAKTFSNVRRLLIDVIALAVKYLRLLGTAPNEDARQAVLNQLAADEELARILAEIESYRRTELGLVVRNFYHPRSCYLRERFFEGGVPLLLARATQLAKGPFRFEHMLVGHAPTSLIKPPYPVEEMEFGRESAYGAYNWELTFHAPHLIASKLIEAGEFDQAETWLRYIFDPLGSSNEPAPRRHWNTKPFYLRSAAEYGEQLATAIMDRIASDPNGTIETELADAVLEWRRNPLKPYLIARSRTVVFQQAIVDATIRMFIGRGDQYFRRDQLEDLVMASLDYSRAERLLGPRPKLVPPAVEPPPETYNQLEAKLDLFGNALRKIENLVPDLSTLPHGGAELPPPPISLESLYFCVPPSEKLFQLWDLLEERQFNLRNSRTIDGVERSLSLFAPPLSVEEMIKAAAAGLSISAILSGLGAPKPPYRFRVMLRHAVELAEAASGFSRELQQALASRDVEGMARLKAEQQIRFLSEQTANLKQEIKTATLGRESARKARQIHFETQSFYASRPYMNNWEVAANISYGASLLLQSVVAVGYAASGGLALLPRFMIGAAGFGGSPTANASTGGDNFSSSARDFVVGAVGALSAALDKAGSMLEHQGNYLIRKEDWSHSAKSAQREMERADIEIAIADIREAIAKEHLRLNGVQQQQAAAEEVFLKTKFTNRELYESLGQQLRGLSRQMYNLAFEAAKAAERCFNFELGTTESFVRPGQWNDTRRGLLAAENLGLDLRRMDSAYLKRNVREREITTHLSLSRLDPIALMELRTSGRCVIQIPEAVFDLEHPGHYFRRIKSLTVSVPCVAGPYASVPLKLTQTSNRVRVETSANPAPVGTAGPYDEVPGADPRFRYNVGSIQTIETSRGDEDGGLFSLDLGDERYLPYEGSGACGMFMAELPAKIRSFDYGTISDVILTMRYTARDGGGGFRTMVETGLEQRLNAMALAASRTGLWQAFDLRRDLPDVWHRLVTTGKADLTISADDLPYFVSARVDQIVTSRLVVRAGSPTPAIKAGGAAVTLNAPAEAGLAGLLSGGIAAIGLGVPLTIEATTPAKLEEMILIVNYTIL